MVSQVLFQNIDLNLPAVVATNDCRANFSQANDGYKASNDFHRKNVDLGIHALLLRRKSSRRRRDAISRHLTQNRANWNRNLENIVPQITLSNFFLLKPLSLPKKWKRFAITLNTALRRRLRQGKWKRWHPSFASGTSRLYPCRWRTRRKRRTLLFEIIFEFLLAR